MERLSRKPKATYGANAIHRRLPLDIRAFVGISWEQRGGLILTKLINC